MKKLSLFLLVLFVAYFTSCRKDDTSTEDYTTTSNDMLATQSIEDDVEDVLDENISFRSPDTICPVITWQQPAGVYPNQVTLDFGTSCVSTNGRERSGKIIINMTDSLIHVGASRVVTFDNYYVDGVKVEGSSTWTNTGLNASSQPTLSRNSNIELIVSSTTSINWSAQHVLTMVAGYNTPLIGLDDQFEITGSASGVNHNGKNFSAVITTPILRKKTCRYPVSGVRNVTVETKTISIDYGTGDCDNIATVTKPDGSQVQILIRRWW